MTDAQIGLSIATPVIVTFAIALFRMGVLRRCDRRPGHCDRHQPFLQR